MVNIRKSTPAVKGKNKSGAVKASPSRAKKKTALKKDAAPKTKAAIKKSAPVKSRVTATKKKAAVKKSLDAKSKAVTRSKKSASKNITFSGTKIMIADDQRQKIIGEAAYLISLKRDQDTDNLLQDWVQAETVIDMLFEVSQDSPA